MTSTRKFYRTVIEVEVLSEEPYNPTSLSQIDSDTDDGPCSGQWKVTKAEEVDGPTMARLLLAQAFSPEFFQRPLFLSARADKKGVSLYTKRNMAYYGKPNLPL